MTLIEFADEMNRIIPRELNRSLDVSVEAVRDLCRAAGEVQLIGETAATSRRAEPEAELRGLLRDRGLVLRGPLDPRARRLTLVRSRVA